MPPSANKIIGLIPAAGRATRISPLPCSKEIFPVGRHALGHQRAGQTRAACDWLLEGMHRAGARRVFIIIRPGKWDIPTYLGNGSAYGVHLAYLQIRHSKGVPFTTGEAYPFIADETVLFGFPDIIFEPTDVYTKLLEAYHRTDADVVLALFAAANPRKADMVRLDAQGRLEDIAIKPQQSSLSHTWLHAVWSPVFTQYLHDFNHRNQSPREELHMGHVFVDALHNGLKFETVFFDHHRFLDIGTPEDLAAAADLFIGQKKL